MAVNLGLNEKAWRLAEFMTTNAQLQALRIAVTPMAGGARVLDCGVKVPGGLQAGLSMARICLAGQAEVGLIPGEAAGVGCPIVQVHSDQPVLACMASQFAGWEIALGKFFGMGSGPMRAIYGKEELYDHIAGREQPGMAVGVLESDKLPGDDVLAYLADKLQLPASKLLLLVASTASLAGTLQVVARSLETALHKLHELNFDLNQVVSGFGSAPLPPIAKNPLEALGWTNDSILYGSRVVLWVNCEDDLIAEIGPKVPSNASPDYGAPVAKILKNVGGEFYKIDPLLFSPAEISFSNLKTGRYFAFGKTNHEVLRRSFFGGE